MPSENPLLDQLAKLLANAAGAAKGVRDEIGVAVKTQAERLVNDLDLVPREEFESVKAMALESHKEVERLAARLAMIESRIVKNDSRDSRASKASRNLPIRKSSPDAKYRR